MKQLKLFTVLSLLAVCFALLPQKASAFAELPVAVVIVDRSGNVSEQLAADLATRVKRRFTFPHYKLLSQHTVSAALAGKFPEPDKKPPYMKQPQMEAIAAATAAELVVAVWVRALREEVYQSYNFWNHETLQWVYVDMYVTAYRKSDNKYFQTRARYNRTDSLAASTPAYRVMTDEMTEAVNKMREVFPIPVTAPLA